MQLTRRGGVHTVIAFANVSFKMAENIIEECAHWRVTCVSIGPNLKPEVAHWAAASACDCGRTGGHSFCQTHWDWWSGLERRPGVFSYSNGPGRDSWTLYIALWACTCAYLRILAQRRVRVVDTETHCAAAETTGGMKERRLCVSGTFLGPPLKSPKQPRFIDSRFLLKIKKKIKKSHG